MDELKKNDAFSDLMKKSKLEMPFSDFEDVVMQQIEESNIKKSEISKQLKLSRFFFILGSLFGILISLVLSNIEEPIFNINPNVIALIFQVIFVTLFLLRLKPF
jgi:hypothetical protein